MEKELKRIDIRNTPDKEFKVMIVRIVTELEERVKELSEILNKEREKK